MFEKQVGRVLESAIGLGFADNLIFTEAIKVFEYLNT
jgi:hypothetical protein